MYWISVNGLIFINKEILNKNQFFAKSEDVLVSDGILKIVGQCEGDCGDVWSRINAVEIKKSGKNS